jgi:antitoxin component YwqK of YwqJK toxin-antitoxin module
MNNKTTQILSLALLLLFTLSITACGHKETIVEEKFPDGSDKVVRTYKIKGDKKELIFELKYYPNKNKEYEGEYKNDQKHGDWIYWYENGFVWSEGAFYENKSDGIRKVYHENGQLYYEGEYDKGKQVGKWVFYDENGKLIKEETF